LACGRLAVVGIIIIIIIVIIAWSRRNTAGWHSPLVLAEGHDCDSTKLGTEHVVYKEKPSFVLPWCWTIKTTSEINHPPEQKEKSNININSSLASAGVAFALSCACLSHHPLLTDDPPKEKKKAIHCVICKSRCSAAHLSPYISNSFAVFFFSFIISFLNPPASPRTP
jgi:hypothetical protein